LNTGQLGLDSGKVGGMEDAIASCSSFATSRDGVVKSTRFEFFSENSLKYLHHWKISSKIL